MLGSAVGRAATTRKKKLPPYCVLYAVYFDEVLILRIVHERSYWIALV